MVGRYYDANQVEKQGVPVSDGPNGSYPPGHKRLAMVLDNGAWKACPDVTNPAEFKHHYDNYASGSWLSYRVYSLPDDFQLPQ